MSHPLLDFEVERNVQSECSVSALDEHIPKVGLSVMIFFDNPSLQLTEREHKYAPLAMQ